MLPGRRARALLLIVVVVALVALVAACERHETECNNDVDDDHDGLVDCADPDCALDVACSPCGDGHLDDGEACDDGNNVDGDGCSSRCVLEKCGNGVLDPGEQCDDGNLRNGDGCNFRCKIDPCGNGILDPGEQCDDGNARDGDGCSSSCKLEGGAPGKCGNGVLDPGEQCDDGNHNDGDGCSHICRAEFCGDNIREPLLGEQCDGSDTPPGATCVNCQIVHCGNGIVEPELGEQCDDGNQIFGDGCTNCQKDRCGDGFISQGEQCDDANTTSGDGCSSTCHAEFCGDGVLQPKLGELCDGTAPAGFACLQCAPTGACASGALGAGGFCFGLSRAQTPLVPSTAVLVPAQNGQLAQVFIASPQSSLFQYFVQGASPNALNGGSFFGGDLVTALVVADDVTAYGGTVDGRVGRLASFGQIEGTLQLTQRITDLAAGDVTGAASDDVVAVAVGGAVGVIIDGSHTAHGTAPFQANRVAAGGGLVVVAGGTQLALVHVDGAANTLTVDAPASAPSPSTVADVAVLDVDGDGAPDVVLLGTAPDELYAYAGGDLGAAPRLLAHAPGADRLAVADVDGDGAADLIASGDTGIVLYLAKDAFAPLDALPNVVHGSRVDARDIDGNGSVDLLVVGGEVSASALLYLRE